MLLHGRRRPVKRILGHLPAANKLRAKIRAHTEPWIGDLAWPFPSWSVRRRVFDWAVDEADIPLDPEDHWHRADRQQFDLYLPKPAREPVHSAGAVVRR